VFLYNKLLFAKREADQIRSVEEEEAGYIAKRSEIHQNAQCPKFNLKKS